LLFCGPSTTLMLPLFASQILHVGPAQLGVLFSAAGAGTVVSAFTLASLGPVCKERLLFYSILLWIVALAAFGWSSAMATAVPALLILGAAQNGSANATVALLQTRVPPAMRGRAMALNTLLIMIVRPLGDFPAGALIGLLGLRWTLLAAALTVGIILSVSIAPRLIVDRVKE
jgi:hypothetical protein